MHFCGRYFYLGKYVNGKQVQSTDGGNTGNNSYLGSNPIFPTMKRKLYIDIETFSSVDISTAGAYKYMESIDFEILMVAFAFDDEPIVCIDLAQGEQLPKRFIDALYDPNIEKHAHNANFERNAFKAYGYDIPVEQWHCSAVKSAYCGLPLSLEMVSQALKLE